MFHWLSAGTLRAVARCIEWRQQMDCPADDDLIRQVAEEEDTSASAVLVLHRWELWAEDGRIIPLDVAERWKCPPAVVPDTQTAWAILATGRPVSARLTSPSGEPNIAQHELSSWALAQD